MKSVSFLLHSDHGFTQAHYEEIDEKTFNRLSKKFKSLEGLYGIDLSGDLLQGIECEGGACPIK